MRREVKRVALSAAQWICMETPSGPAKPGHLPHRGRLVAEGVYPTDFIEAARRVVSR